MNCKYFILFLLLSPFANLKVEAIKSSSSKAAPFFRNGEAQRVNGFGDRKAWIKQELWVETDFDSNADGKPDRMHVMITRPHQTTTDSLTLPVIYVSSPYFSGIAKNRKRFHWDPRTDLGKIPKPHKHPKVRQKSGRNLQMFSFDMTWVPRGYIMVYSSSPGTGMSDGSPTIGGKNETLAPKAVINWLCGKNSGYKARDGKNEVKAFWCNGNIGMIGTSYNGTLALAAATTGVEGLKAIIPIAPVTNWYSYYRSNGLVRSPGGYVGEDMDVLFDGIHSGDKKNRKRNSQMVRDSILVPGQDRLTGDNNDFWERRNYLKQMGGMKAAMLMMHSFDDWNVMLNHSIEAYEVAKALGIPVKLYLRPGGHGESAPFQLKNLWFTKYLHEHENGVDKLPEVMILREGYASAIGYPSFPDEKSEKVTFYPVNSDTGIGKLITSKPENSKIDSLTDDYGFSSKKLALSSKSKNRLLYVSSLLNESIRISGKPEVSICLRSSASATNLSVYLVSFKMSDQGEIGGYSLITRGWADPQNHSSILHGKKLDPTEFYTVNFDLVPDDHYIDLGHKIGLMIFSSDQEFTLHPEPGTVLEIDLDKTVIKLPIVGGIESYQTAIK